MTVFPQQVSIVGSQAICRNIIQEALVGVGKLRIERVGYRAGNVTLDREKAGWLLTVPGQTSRPTNDRHDGYRSAVR